MREANSTPAHIHISPFLSLLHCGSINRISAGSVDSVLVPHCARVDWERRVLGSELKPILPEEQQESVTNIDTNKLNDWQFDQALF